MTKIQEKIKFLSKQILPEVKKFRHHLHQFPELSFEEKNTSTFICSVLDNYGIPYTTGWAGYGIVAMIHGQSDEPVVALRADMDALPITELNDEEYKSRNHGVMHACGHDVHMSSLLGAAILLQQLKSELKCSVKLIFQPGEEKLPGGASMMIKEGVLKSPSVKCIIAQHVFPSMKAGQIGWRKGLYMASADEIYLKVTGKGGHAAMPTEVTDTVFVSAQIIVALQQIVSRKASPLVPTVLSFGKLYTNGGTTNVIPDEVYIEGTFRTMDERWRAEAHDWLNNIAKKTAEASGASCEVNIMKGYPVLINHESFSDCMASALKEYAGSNQIFEISQRMTSEDFSFYSLEVPAFFYRLGTAGNYNTKSSPVHTPLFDIDEDSLETGVGMMTWLAIRAMDF